jgi:hypothetical protein
MQQALIPDHLVALAARDDRAEVAVLARASERGCSSLASIRATVRRLIPSRPRPPAARGRLPPTPAPAPTPTRPAPPDLLASTDEPVEPSSRAGQIRAKASGALFAAPDSGAVLGRASTGMVERKTDIEGRPRPPPLPHFCRYGAHPCLHRMRGASVVCARQRRPARRRTSPLAGGRVMERVVVPSGIAYLR